MTVSKDEFDDAQKRARKKSIPAETPADLAVLLRLATGKIGITAIRLFGNGPSAALELDLSTGLTIKCEHFGDLWTTGGLEKWITQSTGMDVRGITKDEAAAANALIRRLASLNLDFGTGDHGFEHGVEFLQFAPVEKFTLNDRQDRYRAFSLVSAISLGALPESERPAAWSLVLENATDGVRFVRAGHLFADVQHRYRTASPAELARQMTLAGWRRQGKHGYIKATSRAPGSEPIVIRFWRVPPGWESVSEDA